jgi:hypothetical protein
MIPDRRLLGVGRRRRVGRWRLAVPRPHRHGRSRSRNGRHRWGVGGEGCWLLAAAAAADVPVVLRVFLWRRTNSQRDSRERECVCGRTWIPRFFSERCTSSIQDLAENKNYVHVRNTAHFSSSSRADRAAQRNTSSLNSQFPQFLFLSLREREEHKRRRRSQ